MAIIGSPGRLRTSPTLRCPRLARHRDARACPRDRSGRVPPSRLIEHRPDRSLVPVKQARTSTATPASRCSMRPTLASAPSTVCSIGSMRMRRHRLRARCREHAAASRATALLPPPRSARRATSSPGLVEVHEAKSATSSPGIGASGRIQAPVLTRRARSPFPNRGDRLTDGATVEGLDPLGIAGGHAAPSPAAATADASRASSCGVVGHAGWSDRLRVPLRQHFSSITP